MIARCRVSRSLLITSRRPHDATAAAVPLAGPRRGLVRLQCGRGGVAHPRGRDSGARTRTADPRPSTWRAIHSSEAWSSPPRSTVGQLAQQTHRVVLEHPRGLGRQLQRRRRQRRAASNSDVSGGAWSAGSGGAEGSSSTLASTMRSNRNSRTPSASRDHASR